VGGGLKKLGVLGTMIWDTIIGRDPAAAPFEEWGGISYALAALDAALPPGWQVVPLVKVGRDLADGAHAFLRGLRTAPGTRFVEVPAANPRVRLNYRDTERRCEGLQGGVPPWTWGELGPMVLDLDALYVNFITGFECDLATAQALRQAFHRPLYGDLHSLALGIRADGLRQLRPIEEPLEWLACFDIAQLNEDEMHQMGNAPLELAARAVARGVQAVCVTLGPRGAVYVAAPRFDGLTPGVAGGGSAASQVVRTARIEPEGAPVSGDPTGCGDVFGSTLFARLLAGEALEPAIREANRMARRNVSYRGATGLQDHLRGALARAAGA
jgi:sugar/nucleoside kinase (ribokinase family)